MRASVFFARMQVSADADGVGEELSHPLRHMGVAFDQSLVVAMRIEAS